MTSVAGRIGPSYYIELSGPESVHGAVNYVGNGVFKAEYVGPIAGVYKLEVRLCGESIEQSSAEVKPDTSLVRGLSLAIGTSLSVNTDRLSDV